MSVTDDDGNVETRIVNVTVQPVNDAPVAANDVYFTAQNTTLSIPANIGLLSNDSDVESPRSALSVIKINGNPVVGSVVPLTRGVVTVQADGSLSYVPNTNEFGFDVFTYTVTDGFNETIGSVTIAILSQNRVPVAVGDLANTTKNTAVNIPVLTNDLDQDGNTLAVSHVNGVAVAPSVTLPSGATLAFSSGVFTYTPVTGFVGTDSFSYTINDGNGGVGSALVIINVSAVTNANPTGNGTTVSFTDALEDTAYNGSVASNHSDPNGDQLTFLPLSQPSHGSVLVNADGTFRYTPSTDYSGTDSFTYRVIDSFGGSASATVSLTIAAVNDAPVANPDIFFAVNNAVSVITTVTNDTDVDGPSMTITHINGNAVTAGQTVNLGMGTLNMPSLNGTFNFTPAPGAVGVQVFTYTITDGTSSSTATATIGLIGGNAAPTAVDDAFSVDEDWLLTATS